MKEMKFAIFDFDGTLVDSQWVWQTVLLRVLRERGIEIDHDDVARCLDTPWLDLHSALCDKYGIREPLFRQKYDLFPYVDRFYQTEVFWKPTVPDYLNSLKEQGVTLALFSATPSRMLRHGLAHLGGEHYFEQIFSGEDLGWIKTDPASFRNCLEALGATTENSVLFEDSLYSIKSAKAMGMIVYAVQERCSRKNRAEIQALSDRYAVRMAEFMKDPGGE